MPDVIEFKDDISIVLCGEAGQGIQTIEVVLTRLLKRAGYHVCATKEYMSRVRGGSNSTEIRVSSKRVSAFVERIDLLIPLDSKAIPHLDWRISKKTIIAGDRNLLKTDREIYDIPFQALAGEIGNEIFSNTIAAGFVGGLFNLTEADLTGFVRTFFAKKEPDIVEKNCAAVTKGLALAREFEKKQGVSVSIRRDDKVKNEFFLNGAEAVGLGAIAGGCDFISAYPMSPSTGVLTFLAQNAEKFGVIVDQAEDEIAGINAALGSWYAGGKGLASTSGGGFALMTEGLSLAGAIESPLVIHLAQRPGPATGLPTRTEQGDLDLALYAGHGEFPRVIFAPGTIEDAFLLSGRAFDIADRFQVPVFILTDQFLVDLYYNVSSLPIPGAPPQNHIVETGDNYKRYQITENGISPRGIPGFGKGVVCVDSDEHDESGFITEDFRVRTAMADKRLRKMELLKNIMIEPELIGIINFKKLVIGWGSTYSCIKEALEIKNDPDTAFLYCKQVYPLHPKIAGYIKQARETVLVENNATGQFAKLIRRETGLSVSRQILQYNGFPFSVETLAKAI